MSVPPRVPPGNHDWATDFQYWLDVTMEQPSNIINGYTDRNNVHHAFPPAGFSEYIPRGQQGACERQLMRALNDFWPRATDDEKDAIFRIWGERWGFNENKQPTGPFNKNNLAEYEEFLRSQFFGAGLARCHKCRMTSAPLPGAGGPVGTLEAARHIDIIFDDDIMPCGCNYQDALYEMWCIHTGRWTRVPRSPNYDDYEIPAMNARYECRLLSTGLAPAAGVAVAAPLFHDYASRTARLTALRAEIAALGVVDNNASGEMPTGSWNIKDRNY